MTLVQKEIKAVYTWTGKITDMRGPCPEGYHVPTKDEWEKIYNAGIILGAWTSSGGVNVLTYLKIPLAGMVSGSSGSISSSGTWVRLWSSTAYSSTSSAAYDLGLRTDLISVSSVDTKTGGFNIRAYKDSPVIPDSGWTILYQGTGTAGIYHNSTLGLISISSNGTTWHTIADKNVGATTVYNYGDTVSADNSGNFYQWGNNYGFAFTGPTTTSGTQVDAQNYGPSNPYSSSTFIYRSDGGWDSSNNGNLRGGVTGVLTEHKIRPTYKREPTADTLAWYPLETDTKDYSGNSRDGTNSNVTFSGGIATFNGSNAMVEVASASWQKPTSNFTISVWARVLSWSATEGEWMTIVGKSQYWSTSWSKCFYMIQLDCANKYINGTIYDGSSYGGAPGTSSTTVAVNDWHLYTLTNDGTTKTLYLDGTQILQGTGNTTSSTDNTIPLTIGNAYRYNHNAFFNGNISNVILETKTWTQQDIQNYYNRSKGTYGL